MGQVYTLLNQTITAAQAATATGSPVVVLERDVNNLNVGRVVTLQAAFTYGSGGTTADAYVQTSIDGGSTWVDIAEFHFTTASATRLYNLRADASVTSIATPGDGALSANTSVDGLLGDRFRVKWASTGTYAGGTTLVISMVPR